MRAWGRGALPITKMAALHSWLSRKGFTQLRVASGTVSWGRKDDTAGELQLWYRAKTDEYCINASKAAGYDTAVCKVIDVFNFN